MHRDTTDRLRAAKAEGKPVSVRIEMARQAAAERAEVMMPERTLPDVGPEIDLVTMTMPELHDLVYNATSTMLRDSMPHMTKQQRQLHADRIASQALLIVRGQDYLHQGADPRG